MRNLLITLLCALPFGGISQIDIAGTWKGPVIVPGGELEIIFHFEEVDVVWAGTFDVPVQQISGFELTDIVNTQDVLSFGLADVPGNATFVSSYLSSDSIAGTFTQMGQAITMYFKPYNEAEEAAEKEELQTKISEIRVLIDSLREKHEVPAVGVGIIYNNEVVLSAGFGYRNIEKQLPATENTLFAIGSCSKAFTAMILGMQVDDGLLEWNKPVRSYLPDFELMDYFATAEMTPKDLLIHNSGLPRHDLMWYCSDYSRKEIYGNLKYLEPTQSFRSTFQYNNLMFMTAGYLSGQVAGSTWEQLVQAEIFDPLGMDGSNTSVEDSKLANDFATPYAIRDGEVMEIPFRNLDNVGPAGSINSSVSDMLKWVNLHLNSGIVNDEVLISNTELSRMHSGQMTVEKGFAGFTEMNYGLGWMIYHQEGKKVVTHGGAIDGFLAQVHTIPSEQFGLVILTNSGNHGLNEPLLNAITDYLVFDKFIDWATLFPEESDVTREESPEAEQEEISTSPHHALEDYAGLYEHPAYGIIEITLLGEGKKQKLHMHYSCLVGEMEYGGFEIFKMYSEEWETYIELNFLTEFNGEVMALFVRLEDALEPIKFDKLPPNLLEDVEYVESISGRYELDDENGYFTINMEGGKLYINVGGYSTLEIVPISQDLFGLKEIPGYEIEFVFDNKGVCTHAISHQPDGDYTCEKTE